MKHRFRLYMLMAACGFWFILGNLGVSQANNLMISNICTHDQNLLDHYTYVQCDVAWENSWRNRTNWDAVWLFIKFKWIGSDWSHATLGDLVTDHIIPAEAELEPTNKGVFLFSSYPNTGQVNYENISLRWNYGQNGVQDTDLVTIKVIGIEMVYVGQASFWVGDKSTTNIHGHFSQCASNKPFYIDNEAALKLGGTSQYHLCSHNSQGLPFLDDFNSTMIQNLPRAFPKGFNPFYCMKYELTQKQYADFLNTLTTQQSIARFPDEFGNDRHSIYVEDGYFKALSPDLPCNFINWEDGLAYADWAALRPMTELEFEKACRGPVYPVPNEFAWGTAIVADQLYDFSSLDQPDESIINNYCIGNGCGNAIYNQTIDCTLFRGPVRVGICAAHSFNTTRISAGASYYGIMELSGNLTERTVTVGSSAGRQFTGNHGDGLLATDGSTNESNWLLIVNGGLCWRGFGWFSASGEIRVSNRIGANRPADSRLPHHGIRFVRSAYIFLERNSRLFSTSLTDN
ncbi:SUMF1/EgtB/PvdO family nonheme iron enzyme [bacterium]|nr:SUMF1/EgtB/PvdO family nonheme iron enzyme [bacterium]